MQPAPSSQVSMASSAPRAYPFDDVVETIKTVTGLAHTEEIGTKLRDILQVDNVEQITREVIWETLYRLRQDAHLTAVMQKLSENRRGNGR